jgi:hypothetical protein
MQPETYLPAAPGTLYIAREDIAAVPVRPATRSGMDATNRARDLMARAQPVIGWRVEAGSVQPLCVSGVKEDGLVVAPAAPVTEGGSGSFGNEVVSVPDGGHWQTLHEWVRSADNK